LTVCSKPRLNRKATEAAGKDQVIQDRVPARNFRVKGPQAVMPTGRWPEFAKHCRAFEGARNRSIQFTSGTEADLRNISPAPVPGSVRLLSVAAIHRHALRAARCAR